jgi:L-fucose isomerase-like protein
MNPPTIGFVTCVHPFYDLPAVAEARERAVAALRESGCQVIAAPIPRNSQDAVETARNFTASAIDLVVLFFCTWVAEEITLALASELIDVPMLFWALPYLDKDVPMPSPMSGITSSGSNIRRLGKRFIHQIGGVTPANVEKVLRAAKVAAVVRALRSARFGIVGDPCPGMLDVEADAEEIRKALGATAVPLNLDSLLQSAEAASPKKARQAAERLMRAAQGERSIDAERLAENLRLYVALKETVRQNALDGYCLRCWPELRDRRKITPCAAHALLSEEGVPSTCEVDLTALITTWILSRLAGAPAFNFDLTAYLEDEGAVQLAHCGAAAPSLAGDPEAVSLRSHMRTATGATVEFPFKPGPVTLAKLLRPNHGKPALAAAAGEVISSQGIRGSVATVRPMPSAAVFLDWLMRRAVEHHIALVYGSWLSDLRMFCEFTGISLLLPENADRIDQ